MAQMVKNPPAMQETQVRSVGQEDPLEKETTILLERDMVGHFNILAWRIPVDEGDLQATVHRVAKTEETDLVLLELGK